MWLCRWSAFGEDLNIFFEKPIAVVDYAAVPAVRRFTEAPRRSGWRG
jgi:hypothetical protein